MSRAIALALNQFDIPRIALPSLSRMRGALARITVVNADAVAMFAANDAIRSTSRGGMI